MIYVFRDLPNLHTERLTLRKIYRNDINELHRCLSNDYLSKYMLIDFDKSINTTKKMLDMIINGYENDKATPWGVTLKEDGKLIGMCGFSSYSKLNNKAEVGYILNSDYWNKGIITEALCSVIDFGFKNMNLNKIEAKCISGNSASEKVMIKNGMRLDGILRSDRLHKGMYTDLKLYSILKQDK